MANWKGTLVPNSGAVEKVYVNTNLSVEEVVNIVESANLTYQNGYIYILCSNEDGSNAIMIGNYGDGVVAIADSTMNNVYFSSDPNDNGWDPFILEHGYIPLDMTCVNEVQGMPVGNENDKLTSLFSITPFTSGEETTADKLQKLIDNKQLIVDSVNAKAGTSYDIHSKPSDIANTITSIETGNDTSDATATPNDILKGKTAYTAEGKVEGTIETYNGTMSEGAEQIGGSCEPTGLPIEVDELPAIATVVPNSGNVNKIYLNTSMSVEEVVSVIEGANLTYNTDLLGDPIYGILYNDDEVEDKAYGILLMVQDGVYAIVDFFNHTYYFISQAVPDAPFDWVGWNPDFNGEIELTGTTINSLQGLNIGVENDKLINLVSATPFGNDDLIEGAIYKLNKSIWHPYFYHESLGGLNDLLDPNNGFGAYAVFVKEVETIDGLELEESSETEGLKGYYVPSENVVYIYGDFMGTGEKTTVNLAEMMEVNLYVVNTIEEVTSPDIYLIYETQLEYYLCKNNQLIKLEEYNKNTGGNGEPIEVDALPSTGVEGAVYKVSNYVDVILSENGSKTSFSKAGIPIGSIQFVDSLPSNPSGSASAYGIYIMNSTGVVYAYDGSSMNNLSGALGNKLYVGNISSINDTTSTGLYVLESVLYYVYSNGEFTQISSYGEITITENGTYNVSTYKNAIVNVPQPSGTKTITSNGTHDVTNYAKATVNVNPSLQTKTITPTTASQNVSPDSGYYGLSKVVVNAIPSKYIVPTGTLEITENGEEDVSSYEKVNVNVTDFLADIVAKKTTLSYFFRKYSGDNVDFFTYDTSHITNMSYMFASSNVRKIPNLKTDSCTVMEGMFANNEKILTIPNLDTSLVTNMSYMFDGCHALGYRRNLPQLNTRSCVHINYAFMACISLEKIDISYYNFTSGRTMSIVYGCTSLKAFVIREFGSNYVLDSGAFDTSGITDGIGYIYVPRAMVDTLKNATNWSAYADRIRILEDYTLDGTTTGELNLEEMGIDTSNYVE